MESEANFDRMIRRITAIITLAYALFYLVSLYPPAQTRIALVQAHIHAGIRRLSIRLRHSLFTPWEHELADETEVFRETFIPVSKPEWYKHTEQKRE